MRNLVEHEDFSLDGVDDRLPYLNRAIVMELFIRSVDGFKPEGLLNNEGQTIRFTNKIKNHFKSGAAYNIIKY